MTADEVERYYEGFSNGTLWPLYHDVIVVPQYHRTWWDSYVRRSTAGSPRHVARIAAPERRRVGAGLPAAAGPPDAARAAPGPADRVLPAHPVPAGGAVRPAAVAPPGAGGAAGGGPRRVPAARWRPQNFVRMVHSYLGHDVRDQSVRMPDGRTVRAGAFPISIDTAEMEDLARKPDVRQRAAQIRSDLGNPAPPAARRGPAGLHQGHPAPAQGLRRAGQRRGGSSRARRCSSRSPPPAGSGSRSTSGCATRSS